MQTAGRLHNSFLNPLIKPPILYAKYTNKSSSIVLNSCHSDANSTLSETFMVDIEKHY